MVGEEFPSSDGKIQMSNECQITKYQKIPLGSYGIFSFGLAGSFEI